MHRIFLKSVQAKPSLLRSTHLHTLSTCQFTLSSWFGLNSNESPSLSDSSPLSSSDEKMYVYFLKQGNKNLSEGNALQSISDYEQAISLSETADALTKRAFAYFHIKDWVQANKDISRSLEINPRHVEAYIAAGSVQIALEKHEKALEYLSIADELTSPVDFRRTPIQEVINGCKMALKTERVLASAAAQKANENENENEKNDEKVPEISENSEKSGNLGDAEADVQTHPHTRVSTSDSSDLEIPEAQVLSKSVGPIEPVDDASVSENGPGTAVNDAEREALKQFNLETASEKMAEANLQEIPFANDDFMGLQRDITMQMVDIGGVEFQKKLMKLNDIPAVAAFQQKALRGEKPGYSDYMELMKDKRFQRYNAVMTDIAKQPRFAKVTQKFASMDWKGAYEELKDDPDALKMYMKAFDELDKDE